MDLLTRTLVKVVPLAQDEEFVASAPVSSDRKERSHHKAIVLGGPIAGGAAVGIAISSQLTATAVIILGSGAAALGMAVGALIDKRRDGSAPSTPREIGVGQAIAATNRRILILLWSRQAAEIHFQRPLGELVSLSVSPRKRLGVVTGTRLALRFRGDDSIRDVDLPVAGRQVDRLVGAIRPSSETPG